MRFAVLLVIAAGSLSAAPVPKPPPKKPADAELIGAWKIVLQNGERAEDGQAFARGLFNWEKAEAEEGSAALESLRAQFGSLLTPEQRRP